MFWVASVITSTNSGPFGRHQFQCLLRRRCTPPILLFGDFLRYCVVRDARGAPNRESGTRRFLGSASPLVFSDIGALLGVEEQGSKQRVPACRLAIAVPPPLCGRPSQLRGSRAAARLIGPLQSLRWWQRSISGDENPWPSAPNRFKSRPFRSPNWTRQLVNCRNSGTATRRLISLSSTQGGLDT